MNKNDILSELYAISGRVNELITQLEVDEHASTEKVPTMEFQDGYFVISGLERNAGEFVIAEFDNDTLTVFCQEDRLLALREFLDDPRSATDPCLFNDGSYFTEFPPWIARNGEVVFNFETLLPVPNSQNIAINYTNVTGDTHGFFKRID